MIYDIHLIVTVLTLTTVLIRNDPMFVWVSEVLAYKNHTVLGGKKMFTINTLFSIIVALTSLPATIYYSIQIWEYFHSHNKDSTAGSDTPASGPHASS